MNVNPILHPKFSSLPSSIFKPKFILSPKLPSLSSNLHLLFHQNPLFTVTRLANSNANSVQLSENEPCSRDDDDDFLVIEPSVTRILPPALTLEHGLEALKDALHEFKLNPPSCTSGFIRFQVAVPPSVDALEWFSCQPESSGVFPQFYMSKQVENPTCESTFSSKTYGVFGIGAAVYSHSNSDEWKSFRRYLLVDVLNITVYGFLGFNYDAKSSSLKHETGLCCFIIPQIELNECEGFCILAGTLVWSESLLCNFEQALHSYETSLLQAIIHVPATLDTCFTNFMKSIEKFNIVEDENLEMIYMDAPRLGSHNNVTSVVEMVSSSS